MSIIRQLGDPILHTPAPPFDWQQPRPQQLIQIHLDIMRPGLYDYSGVGIAANQCAELDEPTQIIIVGTNDENCRKAALERYPGQEIPHETVMINPEIQLLSDAIYYPTTGEGCLSVMGALRARVARHQSVEVSFETVTGEKINRVYQDFAAHVVQHEVDHLRGITFMQKLIAELNENQKKQLKNATTQVLQETDIPKQVADNQPLRVLAYDRHDAALMVDDEKLLLGLSTLPKETLRGILFFLETK